MAELESIFGRAALDYVSRGLAVVALRPQAKEPATKHGLNDWTDNPEQVELWYTRYPRMNVGGVLGQPSGGIVAIDLDVHDEGHSGLDALAEWEKLNGRLPETWASITGSGGKQLFFRVDRQIRNSANAELGVDIRGDGGYVVLPPSIHPNGEAYEWSVSPDDCEVADADANVYAFIDHVRPSIASGRGDGERFSLPDVIDANRNDTLFRYASSLRATGRDEGEIAILVRAANERRCRPPLDEREVAKICGSVSRYEQGRPPAPRGSMSVSERPESPAERMKDETSEKIQNLLLAHVELRDGIKLNRFDGKLHVLTGCIPGVEFREPHVLSGGETAKLFTFMERDFGVRSRQKFNDAMLAFGATRGQQYDPMAERIAELPLARPRAGEEMASHPARVEVSRDGGETWEEVDAASGRLLPTYLGCMVTDYNAEAERLVQRQLVARAMWPGCKADVMPILVGKQGIGKSTFVSALALDQRFFLEGFSEFDDEDTKRIAGKLVVEVPELDGFGKRDMNRIKSYITRRVDTYRESYAPTPVDHPRTSVFFGTTNDAAFLTDTTGNRRFLPVECMRPANDPEPGIFDGSLAADAEQWWAEGVAEAREVGREAFLRSLVLPPSVQREAMEVQERYTQEDYIMADVLGFLDSLPASCRRVNVKMCMIQGMGYDEKSFAKESQWAKNNVARCLDQCDGWAKQNAKMRVAGFGIARTWVRVERRTLSKR